MYEENYFHTFASHKYFKHRRHDLFLGIKQNGRSKSPKLTYPGQISVQLVLLPNNNTEEKARITSSAKQNRVRQDKRDKGYSELRRILRAKKVENFLLYRGEDL